MCYSYNLYAVHVLEWQGICPLITSSVSVFASESALEHNFSMMEQCMSDNWVTLRGRLTVEGGVITHVPTITQPTENATESNSIPFTEARSNIDFDSGIIRYEAYLSDGTTRCQLAINSGRNPEVYVGLNIGASAYGIAVFKNGKWEPGESAGFGNKPDAQRWIPVEIHVTGSEITLLVDGVRVVTHSENFSRGQLGILFQGHASASIRNVTVESRRPTVFVVMQFTDEYNVLFSEVIKPTCEKFGYKVFRGDDSATTGLIIEDITRAIKEASVVLAEITPDNPNVFYEVGYAHALNKPTILLSDKKRGKLPFDVSGFRTLFYDNSIGGKSAVESGLAQHLKAIGV